MNQKEKSALQNNATFLSKNIVWTEELTEKLIEDGLITEFMLGDIQKCADRQSKVQALLDVLPLKGGKTFDKFCDILQLTGHLLLADFLRDEANQNDVSTVREIYKRLPFLDKNLRDYEKKRLETYLRDMIKGEVVKHSWKKDFNEKDKTLSIKEKQIMQSFQHDEVKKQNQSIIGELEQKLKVATEEVSMLKIQTSALKQSAVEAEGQHKEKLNRQIKFNMANDSSLRRVEDKITQQADTLEKIRQKINGMKWIDSKSIDRDDFGISDTGAKFLLDDLETCLEKMRHLRDVENRYETLQEERDWIIMHIGADDNGTSLVQAYKKFAVKNDEHLHTLKEEVDRYSELEKDRENQKQDIVIADKTNHANKVWQSALMSVLKKQVQDLKITTKQKDKKIGVLENEINSLKSSKALLEQGAVKDSFSDQVDNRNNGLGQEFFTKTNPDNSRSYKNSFLPPLQSLSPVDVSIGSSRKSKGRQSTQSMATWNRGFNPRAHHLGESLAVNSYRTETKVRYGQPYHNLSHAMGTMNNQNKHEFQLGQKAIIGKKL